MSTPVSRSAPASITAARGQGQLRRGPRSRPPGPGGVPGQGAAPTACGPSQSPRPPAPRWPTAARSCTGTARPGNDRPGSREHLPRVVTRAARRNSDHAPGGLLERTHLAADRRSSILPISGTGGSLRRKAGRQATGQHRHRRQPAATRVQDRLGDVCRSRRGSGTGSRRPRHLLRQRATPLPTMASRRWDRQSTQTGRAPSPGGRYQRPQQWWSRGAIIADETTARAADRADCGRRCRLRLLRERCLAI